MTNIVEPFYPCATQKCKERCEIDDVCHSEEICLEEVESLRQQLAECQAREKVLRRRCEYFESVSTGFEIERINELAPLSPSDSTALDSMKKQWQRDALIDAAEHMESYCGPTVYYELHRMAKELE